MNDAPAQLAALDQRHAEAIEGRRRIDEQERAAFDAMRASEAELEALLAERMRGDEPPPKVLAEARKRLERAREATKREWAIERQAGDRVVRDAANARSGFVDANVSALLAAEHENTAPLVAEMDQLASRVIELRGLLAAAEQRTVALVHAVRPGDERLVTAPRSDAFARAAQELLEQGGERVPRYQAERSVIAEVA